MKVSARTAIASRVKSLRKSKADRAGNQKAWPKAQKKATKEHWRRQRGGSAAAAMLRFAE